MLHFFKQLFTKIFIPLAVGVTAFFFFHIKASAAPASIDPYIEAGYIVFETYDIQRTSKIYYQSAGLTISRCLPGQAVLHPGGEYVEFRLDDAIVKRLLHESVVIDGDTYIHTKIGIPLTTVQEGIRNKYGETHPWYTEFKSYYIDRTATENSCVLKLDDMIITINEKKEYAVEGYVFLDPDKGIGYVMLKKTVYTNRPGDGGHYIEALLNVYGWRNKEGIPKHYDKYIDLDGSITSSDDRVVDTTNLKALYETRNYSSTYDISRAIPSSENVTNEYSAASIYGSDEGSVREKNARQTGYTASYHYYYKEWIPDSWEIYLENVTETSANSPIYNSTNYYKRLVREGTYNIYYVDKYTGARHMAAQNIPKSWVDLNKYGKYEEASYNNDALYTVYEIKDVLELYRDSIPQSQKNNYNSQNYVLTKIDEGTYTIYMKSGQHSWSVVKTNGTPSEANNCDGVYSRAEHNGDARYKVEIVRRNQQVLVGHNILENRVNNEFAGGQYVKVKTEVGTWSIYTVSYPSGARTFKESQRDENGAPRFDGSLQIAEYNRDAIYDIYQFVPAHEEKEDMGRETYSFTAEVNYQYFSGIPQLYKFKEASVYNSAFPGEVIKYQKANSSTWYEPRVLMYVYNGSRNAAVPYSTITENTNVSGITFAAGNSHYQFASTSQFALRGGVVYITNRNSLATQKARDKQECINYIYNNTWSRNDNLEINDGKHNWHIMNDDKVTGCKITDASTGVVYTDTYAATSNYRYGGNGVTLQSLNDELKASRCTGGTTVTIPSNTENGDWPTGMSATYEHVFMGNQITMHAGYNKFNGPGVESIYDHVMYNGRLSAHNGGDPADGYPIRVHTPILSPIEIVKNDGNKANEKTQLIANQSLNTQTDNQLLLDSWYYVKWDDERWTSAVYGEVQGYNNLFDRYVDDKYLRFPFTVIYDNQVYEPDYTGYTQWIRIKAPDDLNTAWNAGVNVNNYESANHWRMTPFYIPSFAEECGLPYENTYVECKVEAINVGGRFSGNHSTQIQLQQNSQNNNYAASTRKCVQLSGYIYDFTITGTDNKTVYTGEGLLDKNKSMFDDTTYPMCPIRQELKPSVLNRMGLPNVRFLKDGWLTNSLPSKQVIPIRNGISKTFDEMGDMWRGQTFAYIIKTIADLDGPNDSIEIKPTYTYIKANGEVLKTENGDFQLYHVPDWTNWYTYNPNDTNVAGEWGHEVYLDDRLFMEAAYDTADTNAHQFGNWLATSVENENADTGAMGYYNTITAQEYMARKSKCFTLSHISIPSELRYISGEYEQLAMNQANYYDRDTGVNTLLKYTFNGYGPAQEKALKYSMQQWHGKFAIPTSTKIIDTRNLGGNTFDLLRYMETNDFAWNDETIVDDLKGRLIINFDIIAYKDGKPYLQYSGGNANGTNMWLQQGFDLNTDPELPVPLTPGDIAIVDMSRSIMDYWAPGIQNIN